MPTIFIPMVLKVFGGKSPIFSQLSITKLSIWFFVLLCLFFVSDRLLFDFVL